MVVQKPETDSDIIDSDFEFEGPNDAGELQYEAVCAYVLWGSIETWILTLSCRWGLLHVNFFPFLYATFYFAHFKYDISDLKFSHLRNLDTISNSNSNLKP